MYGRALALPFLWKSKRKDVRKVILETNNPGLKIPDFPN